MRTQIIFDLEATCEDRNIQPNFDNEVIEIGAVKLIDGQVVSEFQTFVKPISTPILTSFCKNLTHITQSDVNHAPDFTDAIQSFQEWAGNDTEYLSWGFYDRKQLEKDCKRHGLSVQWLKNHRSIKHEHQSIKALRRPVGVNKALQLEGLSFEGTQHRGIDDAKNITRIFLRLFQD